MKESIWNGIMAYKKVKYKQKENKKGQTLILLQNTD